MSAMIVPFPEPSEPSTLRGLFQRWPHRWTPETLTATLKHSQYFRGLSDHDMTEVLDMLEGRDGRESGVVVFQIVPSHRAPKRRQARKSKAVRT